MLQLIKLTVIFILLNLFLTACGVKTAPYPSASTLPNKIIAFSEVLDDQSNIWLNWEAPKTNMLGRPLKSLKGFKIEVSENPMNEAYCDSCPHKFEVIDFVLANIPPPGLDIAPDKYTWQKQLKTNYVYRFRISAAAKNNSIHPSSYEELTVWVINPPKESINLKASIENEGIMLTWKNPNKNLAVEIEKQDINDEWKKIKEIERNENNYLDLQVKYESTYSYRSRLINNKNNTVIPGPWSNTVNLKMIDTIPPQAPGYLDVGISDEKAILKWDIVHDVDLKGYLVYRKYETETSFTKITANPIKANSYTDIPNITTGDKIFYKVTAIDSSPQANESQSSEEVELWFDYEPETIAKPDNLF